MQKCYLTTLWQHCFVNYQKHSEKVKNYLASKVSIYNFYMANRSPALARKGSIKNTLVRNFVHQSISEGILIYSNTAKIITPKYIGLCIYLEH